MTVTIDPRLHDAVIFNLTTVTGADAAALVRDLETAGVRTAVYSTGAECRSTLADTALFDVTVDGATSQEAAARLDVQIQRSVVVEDTAEGIAAGRNAGFALAVGVERDGNGRELVESGADAALSRLGDIAVRTGDLPMSRIPNALSTYDELAGKLSGHRPLVALDFDGTLSEIVPDPDVAVLVDGAAEELARAAAKYPVAILSGRDLADVRRRIDVPGLWYAGSHGFESLAPDGTPHQNEEAAAAVPVLARAADELREILAGVPGARVEHKRFAVAVHYRDVAADRLGEVIASAHRLGQRDQLKVTNGRKVVELRPRVDWDKGTTLSWIGEQIGGDPLPVYLGDDLTDEDAFDAVRGTGIGILVQHGEDGDRPSSARFTLESPAEVVDLLRRMTGERVT